MSELNTTTKKIGFSSNIVSFVAGVGFFLLIIPMSDASIYGYSTIFFALLGMIMLHLALVTRENMQSGLFKILKELVLASETIPIVLIMSILGWLISMNTLYWDRFNNPELLPDSFSSFKGMSTALLGMAIVLIRTITNNEMSGNQDDKGNSNLAKLNKIAAESGASVLYLIITILGITVGLMQTILKYYVTDG